MKWFRREKRAPEDVQWERIQAEVRTAKQWRFEQTVTQRDLVDAVSQILFLADPVGINFETNTDEYDAESETIVIGLPNAHGPEDVTALTHETFVSVVRRTDCRPHRPVHRGGLRDLEFVATPSRSAWTERSVGALTCRRSCAVLPMRARSG
jgi:hypothetical protein